jgi:DNA-binding NarL/FixJ family response regulator
MTGKRKIHIMLVDDHTLFRVALNLILQAEPDFEVVGQGANGAQAISLARALTPDVILMDMCMPQVDGCEATRRILMTLPATKIVMLTAAEEENGFFAAVRCGALGYLSKAIEPAAFMRALRAVARGETCFSHAMIAKLLKEFGRQALKAPEAKMPAGVLTRREREVFEMLEIGKTNKEIGVILSIAENTVRSHVQNILAKLDLESRAQAALHCLGVRHGSLPQSIEAIGSPRPTRPRIHAILPQHAT